MRDWLKTLWHASYKGVPFWVENDEEQGGRRIVEHEFPMRDDPFLEDLGEAKRGFDVVAYVASDVAEAAAAALVAACASRGPGTLVLPTHGPISVRCRRFERRRDKDRHGKIAFKLDFVREGAATALITVASLANLVFVAADAISAATSAAYARRVVTARQSDYVVAAAAEAMLDAVAALEAVRTSEPVEAVASARQRDEIQSLFGLAPDLVEDRPIEIVDRTVAAARALGDAMPAASAVRAFGSLWQDAAQNESAAAASPAAPTRSGKLAAANAAAGRLSLRLAALIAYCEAIVRIVLSDRPAALTLRASVAEYIESEIEALSAEDADLMSAMVGLRDATIAYLSRAVLDLAPVLTVEANRSMPSLYWAWRLYQDPGRSAEIVARNRVQHPSLMPPAFEALAR